MQTRFSATTAIAAAIAVLLVASGPREAAAAPPDPDAGLRQMVCRMIDDAAAANGLPSAFLARILWQESRFRSEATSPVGAEGVAQFMPQTAAERGLVNPRDPATAIAEAARFLADLDFRFGNHGLAAAAYNAGAGRVAKWLQALSELPNETRLYVKAVTGHAVEDWVAKDSPPLNPRAEGEPCLTAMLEIGRSDPARVSLPGWLLRFDRNLAQARARTRDNAFNALQASFALCENLRALGARCEVYKP